MKRNIYLIVITILTVVLIIAGLTWRFAPVSWISFPWTDSKEASASRAKVTRIWEEGELGECRELVVSVDISDITLVAGDHGSVSFEGREKLLPEVKSDNGRWTVTQKGKEVEFIGKHNLQDSKLVVTIPEGQIPEMVDFDADAGDLNVKGMTLQNLSIHGDAGDIDLEDLQIQTLDLEVNAGDIDIVNTAFTEGTLDVDAGDLLVKNSSFSSLTGDFDMGDVEINSAVPLDDALLDLTVNLGGVTVNNNGQGREYHQNGSSEIKLAITADMGDIKVSW